MERCPKWRCPNWPLVRRVGFGSQQRARAYSVGTGVDWKSSPDLNLDSSAIWPFIRESSISPQTKGSMPFLPGHSDQNGSICFLISPALMAPSDSSLFSCRPAANCWTLRATSIQQYFQQMKPYWIFSHAAGRGLIAETEEDQWNFRSGRWQKLDSERGPLRAGVRRFFNMQMCCVHLASDRIPRAQSLHRIRSGRSAAVVFACLSGGGYGA